jgi:hypothetical protein
MRTVPTGAAEPGHDVDTAEHVAATRGEDTRR